MRRAGPAVVAALAACVALAAAPAAAAAPRRAPALRGALPRVARARGRSTAACCCCSRATPRPSPASRSATPTLRRASRCSGSTSPRWKPGEPAVIDASVLGFPAESLGGVQARALPRPGAAAPLRDVPPRRRPRGEAADGPRRRAAVEPRAGQPALRPARDRRSIPRATRRSRRARPGDPRDPAARGHALREAHPHPERAAHEVLGAADAPGRRGAAAARLRRASRGPLPARGVPRALPVHLSGFREQPPDPNLPCEYSDRFRLDCYNRIQQQLAHELYKDWTSAAFPRFLVVEIQHANPVLRRLLRGELAEHRPLRRRDPVRAHPRDRAPLPRHRPGLGALHVRRLDGRLGGARGAGALPGRVERRVGVVPRPDRLPRLLDDEHLRGRERLLGRGSFRARGAARPPQLARPRLGHDPRFEPRRAGARDEGPLRRAVRRLGGGLLAGGGGRLPEADLGSAPRA